MAKAKVKWDWSEKTEKSTQKVTLKLTEGEAIMVLVAVGAIMPPSASGLSLAYWDDASAVYEALSNLIEVTDLGYDSKDDQALIFSRDPQASWI